MITYPLNKIEYNATDAELFHCTRNSGIYAGDDFACTVTGADNNVTIGAGIGWIRNSKFSGKVIANKSDVVLDLGLADASLDRWDVVAIQFDKNNNATDLVVKHGATASTPTRPEIVQTETLYELYIAAFYRKAGATTITVSDIYDLRLDPTVCGLMADSVTEIDTTGINAQINALIENLKAEIAGVESSAKIMLKSVYDTDGDGIVDNAKKVGGYTVEEIFENAEGGGDVSVNLEGAETSGQPSTVNADLLGGIAAENYVQKSEVGTELLWENPDPTSAFAAQTINLDLSNYSSIKIIFKVSSADKLNLPAYEAKIGEDIACFYFNGVTVYERRATVNATNIDFKNTGNDPNLNAVCIPLRIYGIK